MKMYDNEHAQKFWKVMGMGDILDAAASKEDVPWTDLYALEEVEYSYEDALEFNTKFNLKEFFDKYGKDCYL